MIETWSHLHDDLQRLQAATGLLEHLDGQLAHFRGRVVDLSEEETDLPLLCAGVGRGGRSEEMGEVLSCIDANVLRVERLSRERKKS